MLFTAATMQAIFGRYMTPSQFKELRVGKHNKGKHATPDRGERRRRRKLQKLSRRGNRK